LRFTTSPLEMEMEIVGHAAAKLTISLPPDSTATDIDVFVVLRNVDPDGKEVFYTGYSIPFVLFGAY